MLNSTILKNHAIASGIYELELRFDAGVADFKPGQFAHIKLPNEAMLLRRPLSINHVDAGQGTANFIYQVKGAGTRLLTELKPCERMDALAPLGRGFWKPEGLKRAALVGGGMGAAPLRMLPEAWPDVLFDTYLGFRSKEFAYQIEEFSELSVNTYLCSDNGTLGEKTFVTCMLEKLLDAERYDAIFACGPAPMLKALQGVLDRTCPKGENGGETPCQISLEERMGCGVGACLVCNCKIYKGSAWHYRRVCKDGPVFELNEVAFDEA